KTISTFVLDECDEMLSMGFLEDIERVTSFLPEKHQTLLFSATMPQEVERYARRHMKGRDAEPLSSDLSQADRERVMARMKAKNLRFLVATDVAARGIDISNLSHVINFTV